MGTAFNHIGIIGRIGSELVLESVKTIAAFLLQRHLVVILEEEIAQLWPDHQLQVCPRSAIGKSCDLVIVVGGDGSMLGAARILAKHNVPVVGVNRGGLGFLTDISPAEIEQKLAEVLEGQYIVEERFLLDTLVKRGDEIVGRGSAFNDVVVSSNGAARMIEFETYIDDRFVYSQRSDGMIISTPTGSTAYSLSAGGPIMHPKLDALLLVPMFPHTLTSRPIVVDGSSEIKIIMAGDDQRKAYVTCDGHLRIKAEPGDTIVIYKKPTKLKLLHPMDHSFYAVCRDKLGWGHKLVN